MEMSSLADSILEADDQAACRDTLHGGSRTFFAASLLLPRKVYQPATALYAFCRLADDAVDGSGGDAATIAHLHDRLDRAYRGNPLPFAADRAFADVVSTYRVPRALPEALLEGFQWDACGRRYEDMVDLEEYAARVAGTVGAMMAVLMGVRDRDIAARACDLGVAMQLSNIARDVGEDARAGRLYLPRAWLREVGIDPDSWLARPIFSAALGVVVQRLLDHADMLYARADAGIARLPLSCRFGISAARHLYAEIGREVERLGGDSVARRAVVPAARKFSVLARGSAITLRSGMHDTTPMLRAPALAATRALVAAVAAAPSPRNGKPRSLIPEISWRALDDRIAWLFDLFARMEQREQSQRTLP